MLIKIKVLRALKSYAFIHTIHHEKKFRTRLGQFISLNNLWASGSG